MLSMTKLIAPAKLTRNLEVVGVRNDGYHLIRSEMVSLDLADEICIDPNLQEGFELTDEIAWLNATGATPPAIPVDGDNLVQKALRLLGKEAAVKLIKRIPPGAGLGGGSSDAAAIFRWAGSADLSAAAKLGADVPFCIKGGRAMVGGIGEAIEELAYEELSFVVVTPMLHVSTAEVYTAYDRMAEEKVIRGTSFGSGEDPCVNDLEAAALAVEPKLVFWRDLLLDIASERPRLAGSGSSWFFEAPERKAESLAREISQAVLEAGLTAMVKKTGAIKPLL